MDDPEFKVTVKHQTFGLQLNRIFAISPSFSGPAIYFPYIRLHVHINLKTKNTIFTGNEHFCVRLYLCTELWCFTIHELIQVGKAGRFKNRSIN